MKIKIVLIVSSILLLFFFSGCAEPQPSSYLVIAEYELSGGSQTALIAVFEGMTTPVMDAEVRVNGNLIPPFFFPGTYIDADFMVLTPGETVSFTVSIGGAVIMNGSVVVPTAPVITLPASNSTHVAPGATLPLTWTGLVVDEYIINIDEFDTNSPDGYTAYLSGSATSHTVPAGILSVSGVFDATVEVSATNSAAASGDQLLALSQIGAVNTDTVLVIQD